MRKRTIAVLLACWMLIAAAAPAAALEDEQRYGGEDIVELIVELEGDPLAISGAGEPGRAELERRQDGLLEQIAALDGSAEIELVERYTTVLNALAVRAPSRLCEEIQRLTGVKRVHVSAEFTTAETAAPLGSLAGGNGSAKDMAGLGQAQSLGLDGTGTVIAVIDTGIDADHPAFSADGMDAGQASLTLRDVRSALGRLNAGKRGTVKADEVYLSTKIPFAYNYAERSTDIGHGTEGAGDHGTSVAAIAAGVGSEECAAGAAPGAQLLIMKVFRTNSSSASESVILAAIEDAVALGADVINLSLGVVSGFPDAQMSYSQALSNAAKAGVTVCAAAGNEHSSTYRNDSGRDLGSTEDVDVGLICEPSNLSGVLSVASANSALFYSRGLCIREGGRDKLIPFNDTGYVYGLRDMVELIGAEGHPEGVYEYAVVPGIGTGEDYDQVDVRGRIALVRRGEITFVEKSENAYARGALGVVVYNNVDESINMDMSAISQENDLPCVIVSREDGEAMISAAGTSGIGTLTVLSGETPVEAEDGWQPSDFSSWGPLSDLTLKPDLTAVGGNVRTAVDGGGYNSKSGTSMASPQAAGTAALILQYVRQGYGLTGAAAQEMARTLLMNTAQPLTQENGAEYSPRKQGAGLIDAAAALATPAYVTVNGSALPKAELGDDPDGRGEYSFTFTVSNTSEKDVRYVLYVSALTEDDEDGYMLQSSRTLSCGTVFTGSEVSALCEYDDDGQPVTYDVNCDGRVTLLDSLLLCRALSSAESRQGGDRIVTVPALGRSEVTVTVQLTEDERETLQKTFPNGIYVEGYLYLEELDVLQQELSVPMLAFFGDWGKAPLFGRTTYAELCAAAAEDTQTGASGGLTVRTGTSSYLGLGPVGQDTVYIPERSNVLSAAGGEGGRIEEIGVELLRNARSVTIQIWNGSRMLYEVSTQDVVKSVYPGLLDGLTGNGWERWFRVGFDPRSYGVRAGSSLTIRIIGNKDADGPSAVDTWEIPVFIDGTDPTFKSVALRTGEDGRTCLEVTARDDRYIAGFILYSSDGTRELKRFVADQRKKGATVDMELDITDVLEAAGKGVCLSVVDYAGNTSEYDIRL